MSETHRSFRLREDVAQKLKFYAAKEDRSGNWIVNAALEAYFAHKEAEEARWNETLEAVSAIERGEGLEGERVMHWLKGWGGEYEKPTP